MPVHFAYGCTDSSRLFAQEARLEAAIAAVSVGEFEGNEVAMGGGDGGTLVMYRPNADALFAEVRPILEASNFMRGARVKLHYGPPQGAASEVEVGSWNLRLSIKY